MKIIDESKDESKVFSKEITAFQGGYRMAMTGKLVAAVLEFLVLLFFILWVEILIIVFFYIDFFLFALFAGTIIAFSNW